MEALFASLCGFLHLQVTFVNFKNEFSVYPFFVTDIQISEQNIRNFVIIQINFSEIAKWKSAKN